MAINGKAANFGGVRKRSKEASAACICWRSNAMADASIHSVSFLMRLSCLSPSPPPPPLRILRPAKRKMETTRTASLPRR
ncbi:hypothetical protein OPV22_003015 [Ensete ventricosum]|uniref:Uncharacterized protein n=1 Tax=Ensete ventricosum TaxID=4639 RepID=A0AAV8RZK9_ENSVE|nr:hypothetical protein OPV22_003015 [Ensete ventricosum]